MLLQPSLTVRPSLPLSRYPPPFSPPLRFSLSFATSALAPRSRSHLNKRRQSDDGDDATWNLDDEIDDEEAAFEGRKPRGFGAGGIRYNTSLEETLLNEMRRGRNDQAITSTTTTKVKVKKDFPKNKGVKKPQVNSATVPNRTASSATRSGIRVRLWNLPKKKNIHRDLLMAFKGFRGILDISPAISGNKKTRDPVCKGFAFVDLATEEAATRFVETFSKRSISFGRVDKQISCCIINLNSDPTISKFSNNQKGQILQPQLHDGFMGISENDDPSDETPIIFVEGDEEEEDDTLSSTELMAFDDGEGEDDKLDLEMTRLASGEREKAVSLKKRRVRPRKANNSKLSVPLRLKGRERNVLTGAFFKYGAKPGATQTKES
ncbi:hypothetical protein LUZ61_001936 [Rhynchospora tenuis]|uniref:RRM domain-containing protein n=1 Tax=Rhynchospora tenuis TaxID=198213 RepID=A0AAD6ERC5_9POAL|nr:hypothetical protein LUZ61_001936 [Rhynchospora tenuis]